MKIWFIRHNSESLGPYTIEELKTLSVTKDDYVWKDGLSDWMKANSIPELNQLFAATAPPPFPKQHKASSTLVDASTNDYHSYFSPGKKSKNRSRLLWISILLILSLITYVIYANNKTTYASPFDATQKSPEELKIDLAQTEKQAPLNYIQGSTAHHKNLLGEMVIHGTLSNSATLAVFKDVVMQADFISKTNTLITSQKFTVYELIKPGQTVEFKQKTFVPKDVQDVQITIVGATPDN